MTRTAFVTGGTGFIGRHVVEQLRASRWGVVALCRATSDTKHLEAYGADIARGSITDQESLMRTIPKECDAIFHIAGNTNLWKRGNAGQTRDNIDGTRNVVGAALAKNVKVFVHTSSAAAWGEQPGLFDEEASSKALRSFINYERTKYLGELEVDKGAKSGLRCVILNPGNVIGRYDANNWARMIRLVHDGKLPGVPPGAGTFADATEVARAHIAAVDQGRNGERYLLGGTHATYLEMVRIIGRLTGRQVPSKALPLWMWRTVGRCSEWVSYLTGRPPTVSPESAAMSGTPRYIFRSDKAKKELGFRDRPLEDMLREAHEWMTSEKLLDRPARSAISGHR